VERFLHMVHQEYVQGRVDSEVSEPAIEQALIDN
jgi:hypothetical protein